MCSQGRIYLGPTRSPPKSLLGVLDMVKWNKKRELEETEEKRVKKKKRREKEWGGWVPYFTKLCWLVCVVVTWLQPHLRWHYTPESFVPKATWHCISKVTKIHSAKYTRKLSVWPSVSTPLAPGLRQRVHRAWLDLDSMPLHIWI